MVVEGYSAYHLKMLVPYDALKKAFIEDEGTNMRLKSMCRWVYFAPLAEGKYQTEVLMCFYRPQSQYWVRKRMMSVWLKLDGLTEDDTLIIPWSAPLKEPARAVRRWFEYKDARDQPYGHIGKTPYRKSFHESEQKVQRQVAMMEYIRTHRKTPPDLLVYMEDYPLFTRSVEYRKIKELLDELVTETVPIQDTN